MTCKLADQIEKSDLIIIGIGNEWNWVKNGLKNDDRYKELIAVINDSNKPFMKEYNDIKRLMRELTKKAKPSGDDLFDILD